MRTQLRKPGQSIVIMALAMVVIISMVGLSVDVGNAYGQQRRMQNAANSAAYGAMNAWLASQNSTTPLTNQKVWDNAKQALAGNRIAVDQSLKSEYSYQIDYYTTAGQQMLVKWDGPTQTITYGSFTMTSSPPSLKRIQVTVTDRVETFFARIAKRNTLTVNGKGDVCWGGLGLGIMPIGLPVQLDPGYHRVFNLSETNGNKLAEAGESLGSEITPLPTSYALIKEKILYHPVSNSDDMSGTHIGWLSWTGANGTPPLEASLTYPGNIDVSFTEGPVSTSPNYTGDATKQNVNPLNAFQPGDWVNGDTGVKAAVKDELSALLFKNIILPIYDVGGKKNGASTFHSKDLGLFRIVGFDLGQADGYAPPSGVGGGDKYIMFQYLGPASQGTAVACVP